MAESPSVDWMDRITESWARDYPDQDATVLPPMVRLARLGLLTQAHHVESLEPFGLSPTDYSVLAALRRVGDDRALSPSELFWLLELSSGGMTKMLKRLEARGLISRDADPNDGRATRVRMTRKGRELEARAFAHVVERTRELLAPLKSSELAAADTAFKRMLRCFEAYFYQEEEDR